MAKTNPENNVRGEANPLRLAPPTHEEIRTTAFSSVYVPTCYNISMILSPTRLKVATNTVSQLIGKVISAAATIIISLVVAQKLGAAGYGDFAKITTYVAFFFLLADFGINAIWLQQKEKGSFTTLLATRSGWSIFLIFIAIAILAFLPQGTTQGFTPFVRLGIIVLAPAIFFQALITTTNAVFQKHLRYDLATIALAIGSVLSILALVGMLSPSQLQFLYGLAPVLALLVGTIITAVVALFLVGRIQPKDATPLSLPKATGLFLASLPFGCTLLLNVVYTRADIFLLTLFRSTAEVGIYGLAYKVFELALVFPTFFMNAVYPLMLSQQTREVGMKNAEFRKLIKKSSLFLLLTSIVVLLAFWFAAPLLTLINPDFTASIPALRILSLSLPLFFLTSVTMWSLVAQKKQGSLLVIYAVSMAINVTANVLLVPAYGYLASAWITVAAEGLVLVLSSIVLLQTL